MNEESPCRSQNMRRRMSGQELVWAATKLVDLPAEYKVVALRPEIWGPKVNAQVVDGDGRAVSVEVSEFDTVEQFATNIRLLIVEMRD